MDKTGDFIMSLFQPKNIDNKQDTEDKQKLLCVEGLIGAGKSTLISHLKDKIDLYFIAEPVLQWQKVIDSQSLLGNLYKDFRRWSYTFQINSVLTRAQAIEEERHLSRGRHLVMERSLLSDRECFARLYFETGMMSALEWYWYSRYYDFINLRIKHPDAFIYLRVKPEIALKRIEKRNRKEESSITLDYLNDLNRRYEALFAGGVVSNIRGNTPVLIVDVSTDFNKDPSALDSIIRRIIEFLAENGFTDKQTT